MRVGLVGCGRWKLGYAAPAADLYVSGLFKKASTYAACSYDTWHILSARHHVIDPTQVLAPYDACLADMTALARADWAVTVCAQLVARYPFETGDPAVFYIHAGRYYREFLVACLKGLSYRVEEPLVGLAIGRQLRWYTRAEG